MSPYGGMTSLTASGRHFAFRSAYPESCLSSSTASSQQICPALSVRLDRTGRRRLEFSVQLLLGHSKLESTDRYLGIEVDDGLEISEQREI